MHSSKIEQVIAAHIPKSHIKSVSSIYETRWWDYRRMAPGHSFMLFTHLYYRAFRSAARKVLAMKARDARLSNLCGASEVQYKADEVWDRNKAHITGLWKSMLLCDALGMPYDHFCRLACEAAIETGWRRLPKPNHLYSDKIGGHVWDKWIALCEERLFIPTHPIFLVENYVGTQIQDEYRKWILAQIATRKNPVPALSQVLYSRPQLELGFVQGHFPQNVIDRARLLAA